MIFGTKLVAQFQGTYSQQHALDLFDSAQAAEEGHKCDESASGYEDVHGAHK